MIQSFEDQGTRDVFDVTQSKRASKSRPPDLWNVARRKLDQLNQADSLRDLRSPPRNRLEALKGGRKGQHSIRINDQWRICFKWRDGAAWDVEIVDYH